MNEIDKILKELDNDKYFDKKIRKFARAKKQDVYYLYFSVKKDYYYGNIIDYISLSNYRNNKKVYLKLDLNFEYIKDAEKQLLKDFIKGYNNKLIVFSKTINTPQKQFQKLIERCNFHKLGNLGFDKVETIEDYGIFNASTDILKIVIN